MLVRKKLDFNKFPVNTVYFVPQVHTGDGQGQRSLFGECAFCCTAHAVNARWKLSRRFCYVVRICPFKVNTDYMPPGGLGAPNDTAALLALKAAWHFKVSHRR